MAEFESMRSVLIVITVIAILIVSTAITIFANFWLGFVAFGCPAILLFAWSSIRSFPANPPTKWIPEVMGVYVNQLKCWGPTILPWTSPFTINATPMPGGIMHVDLESKEMIPNDRVTVVIPVHMFYEIDDDDPVKVIQLGGVDKAAELLRENIDKLLRQWVTHPGKGPQTLGKGKEKMTLDMVRRMNNEATNHILEELAKDDIAVIHSDIPIEALMGYFTKRQMWPREQQWVQEIEKLSEDEREKLRAEIKERNGDIEAFRSGKKPLRVQSVGLIIRQMIVDNIEADGPSAAAVAKVAEANFNAEIKKINAQALADQAATLKPITTTMDPVQAALILEDKVKQTIEVKKYDAAEPLIAMVDGLGRAVIGAIFNRTSVAERKEADNGNAGTNNGK
jgi:hypothetical protein